MHSCNISSNNNNSYISSNTNINGSSNANLVGHVS